MADPTQPVAAAGRRVLTVSALNREVRFHLESGFGSVWVEGEVSNLYRARSGHSYFSLKDNAAQVKCALFRQRDPYGRQSLTDGQQLLVRGRLSLYEPRGEYQLIVDHVEDAGEGRLRREFERLKRQLAAEGLFAAERKRSLPAFPRTIAVVTSPDGAAIRDVISVVARRYPVVRLLIVPSRVQGAGAERELRDALARAIALSPDLVLLTRGGGSLEDLWAFNDEALARAVAASPLPIVCAVGHESDVSIAEFAADVRGATPSAAAELMVPDGRELAARIARARQILERRDPRREADRREQRVDELARRLQGRTKDALTRAGDRLEALRRRLHGQHPQHRLATAAERQTSLRRALRREAIRALAEFDQRLASTRRRLARHAPGPAALEARRAALQALRQRLARHMETKLREAALATGAAAGRLGTLSPQAVLDRGYSLTRIQRTGAVLRSTDETRPGELLLTRLAHGEIVSRVEDGDSPQES